MRYALPGRTVLPAPHRSEASAGGGGRPVRRLDQAWAIGLAALLLVWPAIWNGYPLVFSDSGTYLGQALLGYVGWDRPPFYSLFLLGLHWRLSLWPVVLGQGLLLAHLLHLVLRAQGHPGPAPLMLTALALALLSGLPFFAAQIQPDLFTGVVVLCAWLIGFRQAALSVAERRYVSLLATLAIAVHQSHLPLAFGLAGIGALLWSSRGILPALRALARLTLPPLMALLALICVNWAAHGIAAPSPYGAVFLATRMLFDDSGKTWLARHCAETAGQATQFKVCALHGDLGEGHNHFLWTLDGPLYSLLGGPKAWAPEAAAIVRGVVLDDPVAMLRAAVENTLEQLGRTATGDGLNAWVGSPGPEPVIARFFPAERAAFLTARQQRGEMLPMAQRLSPLHGLVFLACLLGLLAALVQPGSRRRSLGAVVLTAMVLAAVLGNAVITGALSGPADRYQARLTWLGLVTLIVVLLPQPRQAAAGPQGVAMPPADLPAARTAAGGPPALGAEGACQGRDARGRDLAPSPGFVAPPAAAR